MHEYTPKRAQVEKNYPSSWHYGIV